MKDAHHPSNCAGNCWGPKSCEEIELVKVGILRPSKMSRKQKSFAALLKKGSSWREITSRLFQLLHYTCYVS
jgi:hypothetical protein